MMLCLALLAVLHLAAEASLNYIEEQFTPEESQCLEKEEFLYEPDGKCYRLLSEGPCATHHSDDEDWPQWLVLERQPNGRLRAVCRRCPCCDRLLYVFMMTDNQCHHRVKEGSRFCPHNGTELHNNEFGEGECVCIRSPPHAKLQGALTGSCYELYHRGPCPPGEVLHPKSYTNTPNPVAYCDQDPCAHKGEGYAQWKDGDGDCYKLGSQGPCEEQSRFTVQRTNLKPDCVQPTNALFSPKPFTRPPVPFPHHG